MRRLTIALLALPLTLLAASCGDPEPASEKQAEIDRDVAMVQAANRTKPPLIAVTPQPITLADIDSHAMAGEGCVYTSGSSASSLVIAREADAFFKVGGDITRLAADPTSAILPANSRSLYTGREYSLRLVIGIKTEVAGAPAKKPGAIGYKANIEVRDAWGRVAYKRLGSASCGG